MNDEGERVIVNKLLKIKRDGGSTVKEKDGGKKEEKSAERFSEKN